MALRIRIEHGQDAGKTLRLNGSGTYRFGRSPAGSGQILDMKVSKEHFEIVVSPEGVLLRDLGSSHGTLLNGQIVPKEPRPLVPGDEIRVGLTVMRAMSDGPADTELKPVGPTVSAETSAAVSNLAATSAGMPAAQRANGGSPTPNAKAGVGKPVAKALPPDALVGTTLSGYRILEKVGAGGMGSVYRAEQLSLHREVALKVLADKLVSDSAFVDQFVNEARAAGQLNHPNVVQVYDVAQVDGRHFFSMEFIHGGSVEGKIPKTGGGVPWQDALNWFLDGANALIFAEQKGILHRDIKPDNFMVGQEGSVKLCDLGLAKKSESADLLAQGIIGTPHFIAPEAIRRKVDVDQRADLYSLGCTFYRVLTGKNPFPGASVKEILLAHLNAPIPRASALASDVPKEIDDIVAKLMAKDPAARFQNADDLWEALDKVRLQHGLEAHGFHPGRTKKLLYAAVAALVATGVAVVIWQPWVTKTETVTIKGTDTITRIGPDAQEMRERDAREVLQNLKLEIVEKLGKPDNPNDYEKPGWSDYFKKLRDLAADEKTKGTKAAEAASSYADAQEKIWTAYKEKMERLTGARMAAEKAVGTAKDDAIKAADAKIKVMDWVGALREIAKGAQTVRDASDKKVDGVVLVAEKISIASTNALATYVKMVLEMAKTDLDAVLDALGIRIGAATTPEQVQSVEAALKDWLEKHPAAEADDDATLAGYLTEARTRAEGMLNDIQTKRREGERGGLVADQAAYYEFLRKQYAPLDDVGQGGGPYAGMRLAEAWAKAKAVQSKTEPFRVFFVMRAHEAELVSRLPEFLATKFKEKGWKGAIAGRGWSGPLKEWKADGVVVGDKPHAFADEGPGWFVDLFFLDKGERFLLGADEHEAIAALAEAAGIVEPDGGKRFDLAISEFAKAEAMDASRAPRLAGRRALVEAEKAAKALIEESGRLNDKADSDLNEALKNLYSTLSDPKDFEKAKKAILAAEADWKKAVETAKNDVNEVVEKAPSTIVRALLDAKLPPEATFGVAIPPAPKDPPAPASPAPTDPPAPASPAPTK